LARRRNFDYVRAVRNFTKYLGRSPDTASVEDLRNYQLHLVDHGISPASLNAAITGLKFFFNVTLDCSELMAKMQPVHLPHKLPVILSREEVRRLIAASGNLKHQIAVALAYGRSGRPAVDRRAHSMTIAPPHTPRYSCRRCRPCGRNVLPLMEGNLPLGRILV